MVICTWLFKGWLSLVDIQVVKNNLQGWGNGWIHWPTIITNKVDTCRTMFLLDCRVEPTDGEILAFFALLVMGNFLLLQVFTGTSTYSWTGASTVVAASSWGLALSGFELFLVIELYLCCCYLGCSEFSVRGVGRHCFFQLELTRWGKLLKPSIPPANLLFL